MKLRLDQFCNVDSTGKKVDDINMVFEMLQKVSRGDFHVDRAINQFNHFKQATLFAISTIVVDAGMVNHPFLAESHKNLMEEIPPTKRNTVGVDDIKDGQFKTCGPSLKQWEHTWAKGGSASFSPSSLKKRHLIAKRYMAKLYNPMYRGEHYATLDISMEELQRLNPQWSVDLRYRTISIGVDKKGEILVKSKYYPFITFEKGLVKVTP